MHRLLTRQLKRHFGKEFDTASLDENFQTFLETVADTYNEYDQEKRFIENTLDLNSKELFEANELITQKNKNLHSLLEERSKLLENRIEENEEISSTLKQYKQAMDEALLISKVDLGGIITFVNENLCKTSGYLPEELIGKHESLLYTLQENPQLLDALSQAKNEKKIFKGNFATITKSGSLIYVSATIFPLQSKDGEIVDMNIFQDITDIEEARIKAEELQRAKSQFLANMSHEIRTPMNGMLGFIQLLARTTLDDKQKRYLEIIQSSTNTLLQVINDVLDFSKIESQKVTLELTQTDLAKVLEGISLLFSHKIDEKSIRFTLTLDSSISSCLSADQHKIKQVVSNLLGNAIKFTPQNGSIELSCALLEENHLMQRVKIAIQDSGIGIAPERQSTVFEAFSQADSSTTRKYGGTGLGLSISASLIKAMNSEIKLISALNEGSYFFFEISLQKCSF
ncbi:MAG: PAS domain S-box protein [Epsilonproteobacteria bacterium]|nr:PAS domain S-box protein [Campylobacterota bacterium]